MVHWYIGTLQHQCTRFAEQTLLCTTFSAVVHLLYQMVIHQTLDSHSRCTIAVQVEAAHHVLVGELLWQTLKGTKGLLLALHID